MSKKTLITILLDESGSMTSWQGATILGFNTYIDTLRGTDKEVDVDVTLVKFMDTGVYRYAFKDTNIGFVPYLNRNTYTPSGGTSISDAGLRAIKEAEEASQDQDVNVVIVIQTDGQDGGNKMADLHTAIKRKIAQGWNFVVIGCGIDAYNLSRVMGVPEAMASSYDGNATVPAFENLAANTIRFVHSGSDDDLKYTSEQRQKQGDRYAK